MTPTGQPIQTYEVYPGCDPPRFIRDFFEGKQITIEAFCKNERISLYDFKRMAEEIMTEWELTEATHKTNKDAVMHLINHIRIKHRNEQRNNAIQKRPQPSGRGQHRNPTALDLAREILGESAY